MTDSSNSGFYSFRGAAVEPKQMETDSCGKKPVKGPEKHVYNPRPPPENVGMIADSADPLFNASVLPLTHQTCPDCMQKTHPFESE